MKPLSVYIHVPFCVQKCNYCDFLSAPATKEIIAEYMAALKKEMEQEAEHYKEYVITTIFFGGGTPSLADASDIEAVLQILRTSYKVEQGAEITLEMNPATADAEKLMKLYRAGVNRLSIGLQSADDQELKMLGRIHSYEDFYNTYQEARNCGFHNINVDIMSALPGQNMESWQRTLTQVMQLRPEHISAYSLIVEEGTPLYQRIDQYPPVPLEEEDRRMYQKTKEMLKENGYERYEISNYAKPGFACRHNCVYWQRGDYVGFGIGAASMVNNRRWINTTNRGEYLKQFNRRIDSVSEYSLDTEGIKKEIQQLSTEECMEEYMFLGLRMMEGINVEKFEHIFGINFMKKYGKVLDKWQKIGMLESKQGRIRLTDTGIDISNQIFCDFLED